MGGAIKRAIACLSIALASVAFALSPVAVKADPATPTDFAINNIQIFRGIWQADDWLLLFQYTINQYPPEYIPVSQLFDFRLYDAATQQPLASANVYDYNNLGFGIGISSIYFWPADAPADTDNLYLMMSGNLAYWSATPPRVTYTISGDDYTQGGNQRTALVNWVMQQAQILEVNWQVKMVEDGLLTPVAQTYFVTTIPGLESVIPSVMGSITLPPDWNVPTQGTSAAQNWMNQWDDTAFKAELEKWGETWHVAWNAITGAILFIFMLLCAGFSQVKWGNGDPGFVAGNVIFIIGTFAGLIWWPIVMVEMIILGYWIAHNLFWRNG